MPRPELPPGEIPKPEPATEIRSKMRRVHMQRERRPRTPPFTSLHAARVDGADIKRIEPPQPTRHRISTNTRIAAYKTQPTIANG